MRLSEKPTLAKTPPAALWRAQSVRGLLTAGRFACPAGFGARNPCADCSPPAASLARPAIRGFPALQRRARTSRGCAP
ncbi:hypothetical protein B5F10_08580 [Anaerotruncus colihominis]|nr:hypothetical protein B5F10_08580 [Anaerotruncus colihominis]